jgi:uncharacterized membrane protein YeaQ/YmgE (transglycosylase-associated protein family)
MPQPKCAGRILLALALCLFCATDAYGLPSDSLAIQSIRQAEEAMSFVAWTALGLAAGFIGGQLTDSGRKGKLPDILLGLAGAVAGGWLFYAFGPPGVNGFNLGSHFAAVTGSLIVLLLYYAFRRL